MASFGVASLLVLLLIAFCVSNSEGKSCTRDVDCTFVKCPHGSNYCDGKTHTCQCYWRGPPSSIAPMVDAKTKCGNDADCAVVCPPHCKAYHCQNGVCLCQCGA
ncbi:hypothetical protein F3Y22_tig00111398pilonHSYRG00464 [Hibiscus syriacus]|uniref:Defensin-like protein 263 n=1 Tax=Hibiscus syriacus TaxID=106335 RepID=A0A6A2YJX5_HIBSY|nr:putative defensin-like protein 262 [Hibiscus syriacus]KAE8679759.1 hypothetical protein F3Y22_tig00111398pilonHSYRG00464 [Hibiscus syriacus]